jgi:hypothetical protein
MNYAVKMGSGAMIYILSFTKIGSAIQKFLVMDIHTDTQRAGLSHKPTFIFFQNLESRL